MDPYLSLEEYRELGGKAADADFPRLERLAEKRLNYWTMDRIQAADDDVKLCMVIIIDDMGRAQQGDKDVASVSNDGLSVTYASARTEEQMSGAVYDQIVQILPVELVSTEVGT